MQLKENKCYKCGCLIPECQVACWECEKKGYAKIVQKRTEDGKEVRGMLVQILKKKDKKTWNKK